MGRERVIKLLYNLTNILLLLLINKVTKLTVSLCHIISISYASLPFLLLLPKRPPDYHPFYDINLRLCYYSHEYIM